MSDHPYIEALKAEGFEPFKPLDPDLEYVDVTHYELEMAHRVQQLTERVAGLEKLVQQQALNMLTMAQRLRDFAQSTPAPQSAIILPDRFN